MRCRNKKFLQASALIKSLRQDANFSSFPLTLSPKVTYKLLEREGYYWDGDKRIWWHLPF